MRLIDADALREEWLEFGENEYVYDANAVLYSIDSAPTIDAAPVRRGEWKLRYSTTINGDRWSIDAICSECFFEKGEIGSAEFLPETPPDIAIEAVRNIAKSLDTDNFCPNCGADMRGVLHGTD